MITPVVNKMLNKEPVEIIDNVSFNTTDGVDTQKLFNQKVNLKNYDIAFLNVDEEKLDETDLTVGTYEVIIKDKKTSIQYESSVTILDDSGPEVKLKDVTSFNGNDYLEVATFVEECHDNISFECRYNVYDQDNNRIEFFSHEEGEHTYKLEAYDENGNKTIKNINYVIDNNVAQTTKYGTYYSNNGFYADNPIAKQALTYVGITGYNCEQFFNMSLFNTPGIKEQIKTYSDRQKYKDENRYEVSLIEAMPGDELRYASNGLGQTHVAIYIGNGMAVHGGYNATDVVVYDAIIPIASIPKVYRYKI